MNQAYLDTARLLLDIAPAVFENSLFAMKGGTALNLFVQDLPRLSVDIDVVFVRHDLGREDALTAIGEELTAAKARIQKLRFKAEVRQNKSGDEAKMFVTDEAAEVKVEVNFVFRGTLLPVVRASLTPAAQTLFSANVELPLLDTAELYGRKLVAAMDRQHPRDIFDIQYMLDRFGLAPSFVDCFVAYLAGHNRPVHEVLFAKAQPMEEIFKNEFLGMTSKPVTFDALEATRTRLFNMLPAALTPAHRKFLLSLVQCQPDWSQMPFKHLQDLPAVRWKLMNLAKLKKENAMRFARQHALLDAAFNEINDR